MATYKWAGATIEQRAMSFASLFGARAILMDEIERRAKDYLRAVGYSIYSYDHIDVKRFVRSGTDLVSIVADGERMYERVNVNLEVPEKQFEALVPADPSSE